MVSEQHLFVAEDGNRNRASVGGSLKEQNKVKIVIHPMFRFDWKPVTNSLSFISEPIESCPISLQDISSSSTQAWPKKIWALNKASQQLGASFCSVNIGGCWKVSPCFSVLLGDSATRSRCYGDLVGASSKEFTAVKLGI
ncbi:hypothetical protein F2Q68_00043696 [Brassica cretica]|uniref:Uncharacterized protein n=1 Tax=Brassica cretica TaxID=69181 RepID=A0A8S9LKX1_BRACR|nr:hypothetical protein F2Q68_00043696 [Brassica cretica]